MLMDLHALQKYLHERIPLSQTMGVEAEKVTQDSVRLAAPLVPNRNHRETVFGGSAVAVAILAAWALLYLKLKQEGFSGHLVIQKNSMTYEHPIVGNFTATSAILDVNAWPRFMNTLKRKGRARISMSAILHCQGKRVAALEGNFVALQHQSG